MKSGDVNAVRECIASGSDVNEQREDCETALMFAAENGFLDIVKYLAAHVCINGGGDRFSGSGRGEAVGTQATEYDRAIHALDGKCRSKGGG